MDSRLRRPDQSSREERTESITDSRLAGTTQVYIMQQDPREQLTMDSSLRGNDAVVIMTRTSTATMDPAYAPDAGR